MSEASAKMRATMPDFGPGDTVVDELGRQHVVSRMSYIAAGVTAAPVWRVELSREYWMLASDLTLVPPTPKPTCDVTPPFQPKDKIRVIPQNSDNGPCRLERLSRFEVLEVIECLQTMHAPKPEDGWVVRVQLPADVQTAVAPPSPYELFAADAFERVPIVV